jgi:hypothetical protein
MVDNTTHTTEPAKDANAELAKLLVDEVAGKQTDDWKVLEMTEKQLRANVYAALMLMAYKKDSALKKFFEEHANPDINMEYNEDGVPYADSFIEWNEARIEAGDKFFKQYKEYEETWL